MTDKVLRTEVKTQKGSISRIVNGQKVVSPIELTITDTYYESGRKDCDIRVPPLRTKSTNKTPN